MSRYNPTPEERHPKESSNGLPCRKKHKPDNASNQRQLSGKQYPLPKRALTLTFLVKPQGEPYPTDSGSVPLRFQGRVKPCASNHTLETKQRPPPQRHTELPHPQRLPSDRHSPRRTPSRKQDGVPYRHSAPLSNIWLLMFYHPFFVAPVLTAALFAPEVLGAGLATGLGAAVFAGAFFAEVF